MLRWALSQLPRSNFPALTPNVPSYPLSMRRKYNSPLPAGPVKEATLAGVNSLAPFLFIAAPYAMMTLGKIISLDILKSFVKCSDLDVGSLLCS